MIPIIGLKGNLSKKDSHELRCFINSTTSEFEKTEQVGCGRDVDSPLRVLFCLLAPVLFSQFPYLRWWNFLIHKCFLSPQLPNNTKDKWWQKCLVFPARITQNVIWRRSCLWEILWKTCSSVLDVNYNRTEDKRAVRTVQSSNRGETNSCYNPAFFLQKYKRTSATLISKTVIGLRLKLWRCNIPFTLEGEKRINVYPSELQP